MYTLSHLLTHSILFQCDVSYEWFKLDNNSSFLPSIALGPLVFKPPISLEEYIITRCFTLLCILQSMMLSGLPPLHTLHETINIYTLS